MDSADLLQLIKKASLDAVNASNPANVVFGKVTSVAPLAINVDQKMTLGNAQLVLTRNVTDYVVSVSLDWNTTDYTHTHVINDTYSGGGSASSDTHDHSITGTKQMTIHNALKVGDQVVMMMCAGGQKFIVLDRVKR